MLMLIVTSAVLAAPPGYSVSRANSNDCELSLGPANSAGVVPMFADCHWKDASMERFDQVLSNWPGHAEVFGTVVSSTVKRAEGDKQLVHQVHKASSIANREVMLWAQHSSVDGYSRYGWTRATEPFTPASGHVAVAFHEGYWEAKPDAGGGLHVRHLLYYGPGGSVPGFLVRWFQVGGLDASAKDMRKALATQ